MADDPFRWVRDAPLFVVPRTLDALRTFRAGPGLDDSLARVTDRLIAGIAAHPTKFWVLKQFQPRWRMRAPSPRRGANASMRSSGA